MSGFCWVYVWGLICTSKEQGEAIWDIVLHQSAMAVFQEVKFSDISFSGLSFNSVVICFELEGNG